MWLYRDTNGLLMLTPVNDPPIFDDTNGRENGRWIIGDVWYSGRKMEVTEDELDLDFEVTFENSPVQVGVFNI